MKNIIYIAFLLFAFQIFAQVGINTTTPNAQLDIKSSSQIAPSNTDGVLIPRMDVFPAINPTAAQQGMLVYLSTATTFSGNPKPIGFYYWNNAPADWIAIGNNNTDGWKTTGNSGTNPATNFVGTTDNIDLVFRRGNVQSGRIGNSNTFFGRLSGSASTGSNNTYIGTEAGRDNIAGQQNVFIGRRSGTFGTTGSDNIFIGNGAGIFNESNQNCFLGSFSGNGTTTGANNSFYGYSSGAANGTGSQNAFFGASAGATNTIGIGNTIIGTNANVAANNLTNASAIGFNAFAGASNSLVLGSINGVNSATATVNVGIGTTTPLDRLHVVGNLRMEDGNQAVGKVLTSDANGTATWTATGASTAGTLDQSYDFGGAGNGKTITADSGAVLIDGTDGLVSTGTIGTGAAAPSGAATRMVWNPRKAAFRAGTVSGTQWDDVNVGVNSVAMGAGTVASGNSSIALGSICSALGMGSVAFGWSARANATQSTAFGLGTIASNIYSTAFGYEAIASGRASISFGVTNEAESFGETVLGIGATSYTPSLNGANQFRAANATDRLLVVGNAIDNDNDDAVDNAERSNALVILKNGNTGIGSSAPQDKLHVVGNIRMVDGNQAAGKVLTGDANGTATWQSISANAWGVTGNSAISDIANFIGTTNPADVVFKRDNIEAGRLDSSNTSFGVSSLISNTAGFLNSAYGRSALNSNTTGFLNAAFGYSSLLSNTIGTNNSAFGVSALETNDSGENNVGVGRSALEGNISGNDNTSIGSYSLASNTTGNSNVAAGFQSLGGNSTGQSNVAFGLSSLRTNTTGSNNTAIGSNSDVASASLTNATAIGSRAEVGASNSLVLGSISGVNGATASTKIGIGTTTPSRALHLSTGSSGGTPNPNADFVLESNGAIYQHFLAPAANETGILFGSDVSTIRGGVLYNNSTDLLQFRSGGNTNRMVVTTAGDVGIGTATPGGQFELSLNEGRKPASNTWTITSDARLKNVNGIYQKGLAEILQLKPIRYHYKNTQKRTFDPKVLDKEAYGFLAQEVQPLFPEAVGTDPDGYLNFDLHPILIASVNALKELNAKNEQLEQKSSQLEKENQSLKESVQAINDKMLLIIAEMEKLKK